MTQTSSDPNFSSNGSETRHYAGEGESDQGNVKYTPLDHPLDDEVADTHSNLHNAEKELGK